MIDIHNHIIPGIDDGAQTSEDALLLLQCAIEDGVTHLVCTPHMHVDRFDNDKETIAPAFAQLQKLVHERNMSIALAMAAEVRVSDEFMIQLKQDKVPFLGSYEQKIVVLLEMPHDRIPVGMGNLLTWLDRQNITAVIAHPERNKGLMAYPSETYELAAKGALFQLTAASVAGHMGEKIQHMAHWFLEQNLAFCVASDAHNMRHRPSAMGAAYRALSQLGGEELAQQLCVLNPGRLTKSLFAH